MPEPVIQGWCPGALRPMLSGDGLVVRVRPHGGRLQPAQADGLGRLALAHGNGLIDLSTRANIQVRGVTPQSYGALIDGLAGLGLVDVDAEAEARRNIVVTPFWLPGDGVQAIAADLAAALLAADAPRLPSKFGFAVDCGPTPLLREVSADVRLERNADGRLICRADGAGSGVSVSDEAAVPTALAVARWFLASGGVRDGRGRMARHLADGAVLPGGCTGVPVPTVSRFSPQPGPVAAGVLVGFEFGQMHGTTLIALARHGALRATPWRMLLIEGMSAAPEIDGLIARPGDPMLRVTACSGKPACFQALQPTRVLARRLAPHLPDNATLHVSGCAKGCAHPGPANITLTAQEAGFDFIRGGRAGGEPERRGLTAASLAERPAILSEML
jgi:precorrin-3B synthase